MVIKNNTVFLKKVTKNDLDIIKKWRNSPGVWEFNTQYTLLNKFNQNQWFDEINIKNSPQKMFIIYDSSKKSVGICGFRYFDSINKSADVSIILGEEKNRGKDLGTSTLDLLVNYGFNKLNLHHISARIFSYNFRSIKVFEKMNFKLDAILRDCIWRNGKWWDIYQYSLLSHNYNNKKNFEVISIGDITLKAKIKNEKYSKNITELIDQIWLIENKCRHDSLSNGTVLSYVYHKNKNNHIDIMGEFVNYKSIIVERRSNLLNLKLNQIGVSGIILLQENNQSFVLIGQRSKKNFEYPGYMEFIPSGNIESSNILNLKNIDYKHHLQKELIEELGINENKIKEIETLCFVKDITNMVYDICCIIKINESKSNIQKLFQTNDEYDLLFFVKISDLSRFIKRNYNKIAPTSLAIFDCFSKKNI